ncbi:MAG: 50S ribosomal protein L10, partial [Candidatus Micrarchaeia archaeon]
KSKKKMKEKRAKKIEEKKKKVERILEEIKSYKTLAIIDLNKLPARILQKMRNKIDGKFLFEKKSIIERAVRKYNKELLKFFDGQKLILLSNKDPISLYKEICANPEKRYAKAGEVADFDIIVPAGETNLPPGPALSELKQVKIDAKVAGGKIVIGKDSIVAKKGEKISSQLASVLQKLDIKPFEIKVRIPAIYSDLIYREEILSISDAEIIKGLKNASNEVFLLSVSRKIPTPENIRILLSNAYRDAIAIGKMKKIPLPEIIKELIVQSEREAKVLSGVIS